MPHDALAQAVKAQTTRAGLMLIGTMLGGVLVLNSFVASWLFPDDFYRDAMAMVGALLLAAPLVWHAIKHLYHGQMHMDELAALAIIAAFAAQEYQTAGIVAFFMILSNLIETRTALGARASIESLIRLTPTVAYRILSDGGEETVEAHNLHPGDSVRVRPGDNIPADGEVITGESSVNQANITGESLPIDKTPGDEVFSGTTNLTGAMDIRVTRAGSDTTLGRVQKLILAAEQTKIPLMRLMDRYVVWYTPTILMLAGIVLFFTYKQYGMDRAIAMLVISCPCALILATPTAIVAALSAAARLGVLIKNVANLEWARSLTAVIFDKTGTLTTGELSVTQMMPAPGVEGEDLLKAAASVEQLSRHPVARAVVAVARQAKLSLAGAEQFEEVSGRGVAAMVGGRRIMVGRADWLAQQGIDMSLLDRPEYQEAEGLSMLYVGRDGRCLGWVGLEDRTRPEARQAIEDLRGAGIKLLTMVTGDRWSVARRVAREMGCTDVRAEVLPQDKLELVDELRKEGHRVAVIGDGVNDAPALAAGDLGIAMGAAGSDVAINSASVALMNNDLSRIPFLIRLSKVTTRVIWQNLLFGVAFIVVGQTLSAMGLIPPVWAAVAHFGASIIVVFNSARLVRFGEQPGQAQESPTPTVPQPLAAAQTA